MLKIKDDVQIHRHVNAMVPKIVADRQGFFYVTDIEGNTLRARMPQLIEILATCKELETELIAMGVRV